MKLETYTLPKDWASYLINDDATGLEDGEQETIDNCLKDLGIVAAWCVSVSDDDDGNYTQWHDARPEVGFTDVAEFTFQFAEDHSPK